MQVSCLKRDSVRGHVIWSVITALVAWTIRTLLATVAQLVSDSSGTLYLTYGLYVVFFLLVAFLFGTLSAQLRYYLACSRLALLWVVAPTESEKRREWGGNSRLSISSTHSTLNPQHFTLTHTQDLTHLALT